MAEKTSLDNMIDVAMRRIDSLSSENAFRRQPLRVQGLNRTLNKNRSQKRKNWPKHSQHDTFTFSSVIYVAIAPYTNQKPVMTASHINNVHINHATGAC